jgi:hypothetical protein
MNLLRPHVAVLYRLRKRRETALLLRRIGGRVAPYDWRARLLARFEATIRMEAEIEAR